MSDSVFALGYRFLLLSFVLKNTKGVNIMSMVYNSVIVYEFSILLLSLCALIKGINLAS